MTEPRTMPGTVRGILTEPRTWLAAGAATCLGSVAVLAPIAAPLDRMVAFWLGAALMLGLS